MKARNRTFAFFLLFLLALAFPAVAQEDLDRYTAGNGLVLVKGDSVTIGVGSMPYGTYQYIYMSSLISPLNTTNIEYCRANFPLAGGQEGVTVPIKRIRKANGKIYLFVPLGGSTPFIIEAEEAIASCELAFCRPDGYMTQEEFSKLILMQEAVKAGSLTEDRFFELRQDFMEPEPAVTPEHLE